MKLVVLSDIHANYTALQAVLERLDWLSQASGDGFQIRFLGDLVGYGPAQDAVQCINWLRFAPRVKWIPGNHDEWILKPDGGVRFQAKVTLLSQRLLLQRPENQSEWDWFQETVRPYITGERSAIYQDVLDDCTLGYTHASIMPSQERSAYLYPWQAPLLVRDLQGFRQRIQSEYFALFFGHTHFPMFAGLVNEEIVFHSIKYGKPIDLGHSPLGINPGSIGQPRDGDPRASFVILDMENRTITFHRVDYNTLQVREKLECEQDIHHINRANQPGLNHPLTRDERKELVRQLGLDWSHPATLEKIVQAYQNLIIPLETGDGGEHTANFRHIYRSPKWDLEV